MSSCKSEKGSQTKTDAYCAMYLITKVTRRRNTFVVELRRYSERLRRGGKKQNYLSATTTTGCITAGIKCII